MPSDRAIVQHQQRLAGVREPLPGPCVVIHPGWLTTPTLVPVSILLALIVNSMVVQTIRTALGVRHLKIRLC